jgi:type I restriction enzyme R subunit
VLVGQLRQALADACRFCAEHGVDIAAMTALAPASMGRLQAIGDAVEALIAPDDRRKRFQEHQRLVQLLQAAIKPDPTAREFAASVGALNTIAAAIHEKRYPNPPDISSVMGQIGQVLDQSITGIAIRDQGPPSIDLSKIDFQALADKFRQNHNKKTELEELKALIAAHINRLVQLNPTRADFRETFEALIASYNAGSRSVEEIYKQLLQLSLQLSQEQQRHIRENLSEEELAMFDILLRSAPNPSDNDRAKVKQSARELVERIHNLLVLNWRQKATASRALTRLSCISRSARRCSPTSRRPTPSATAASTPASEPGQPQGNGCREPCSHNKPASSATPTASTPSPSGWPSSAGITTNVRSGRRSPRA